MILPVLWGLLAALGLFDFLSDPDSYPIGWGGGGWAFASYRNYVTGGLVLISVSALALYGFLFARSSVVSLLVRFWCCYATIYLLVTIGYGVLVQVGIIEYVDDDPFRRFWSDYPGTLFLSLT